jgi:hypothetical protein
MKEVDLSLHYLRGLGYMSHGQCRRIKAKSGEDTALSYLWFLLHDRACIIRSF